MTELSAEYGLSPKGKQEQEKVQKLFSETLVRLNRIPGNTPRDKDKIEKEIHHLTDELSFLHLEIPCQGIEFRGVVVDRDVEISRETPPANFVEWGKALGVSPELFSSSKNG